MRHTNAHNSDVVSRVLTVTCYLCIVIAIANMSGSLVVID